MRSGGRSYLLAGGRRELRLPVSVVLGKDGVVDLGKEVLPVFQLGKPDRVDPARPEFPAEPIEVGQMGVCPAGGIMSHGATVDHESPVARLSQQQFPDALPERSGGKASRLGVAPHQFLHHHRSTVEQRIDPVGLPI